MASKFPEEFPVEFLAAIGLLVMTWAQAELILDSIVGILFHQGPNGGFKQLPVSLKAKLAFLTWTLTNNQNFAPYRSQGLELMEKYRAAKELRHDIIHGSLMPDSKRDEMEFGRVGYANKAHTMSFKKYTTENIAMAAKAHLEISKTAGPYCLTLAAKFAPNAPTINSIRSG